MWVRHIYDFPSRWVRHLPSSVTVAFRATKIPTTLRADVHFSITCGSATQSTTLFPVTRGSATLWEMWVPHIYDFPFWWVRHLPSSITAVFRATKILTTLRANVHFSIHLWVRHIVNYIISPHVWVRHFVRNVGPPHLGFSFPVGLPSSFLCNCIF